ncbi:ROK family protein [Microbacterium halotolerans]|uniref:ROK family protein n=1 Tax=Microbacterium halotolerans TaxID=246613 RepID=UPI0013C339D0|nr:ROK family protein [Microbacterium halotolerans]
MLDDHARLPSSSGFVVGIDLGGTKLRAGIADMSGEILADHVTPTEHQEAGLLAQIVQTVQDLADAVGANPSRIVATGIGGAGVPTGDGTSLTLAPNLSGIGIRPFATRLSESLSHPVVLDNDVNVAALGELHHGVGLTARDFVFVSIGTGIGMGIIADGRIIRGSKRAAGEIGFLPFGTDPFAVENHRKGPLEEAVAGDALARRYRRATEQTVAPEEIFARSAAGEDAAIEAVDVEARWISTALVAVAAVLDPEVFVLGGGIGSRKDLLARIVSWVDRLGGRPLDIRHSMLGDRAPVAGAVRLALDSISLSEGTPS